MSAQAHKTESQEKESKLRTVVKAFAIFGVGALISLGGFLLANGAASQATAVTPTELVALTRSSTVEAATAVDGSLEIVTPDGAYVAAFEPAALEVLVKSLADQGVWVGTQEKSGASGVLNENVSPLGPPVWMFPAFIAFLVASTYLLVKTAPKSQGGLDAKKDKMVGDVSQKVETKPEERFADVVGVDEAVEELVEIVDYMKNPEPFHNTGAKMPRGVLLVGQPGTGKTMMARAMAGEADAEYFQLAGSDFVEVFVGVGSSRVRDLFAKARACEKAVIFIDEIDAIGKARAGGEMSQATREWDNTLNSLLVEMDGFDRNDNVVVLGATNRPEILDPALLRPGRFDRKVFVPAPDRAGRRELLTRLLAEKPTADIDLEGVARRTINMTGADLVNLVNEAAIRTARDGRGAITQDDMLEAFRVVQGGRERKNASRNEDDVEIVAWHEAGHALCALYTEHAQTPDEISIVARGLAGGVTWMVPRERMLTTGAARADLCTLLGGRAAEEILLDGEYTTGAQGDLRSATDLAERMVYELGMNGTLAVRDRNGIRLPDSTLDQAVEDLIAQGLEDARLTLRSHATVLKRVAETLLDKEQISGDELRAIAAEEQS